MARTKMAPTLQGLNAHWADHFEDHGKIGRARAELRALLSVARSARWSVAPLRNASGVDIGGGHSDSCRCRLCRALARLDRVSRRKP